jgi:hypothetical protein
MEEAFGVTPMALDSALDQMAFLTSFIEPGDLAAAWPDYDRVLARKDAAVASLHAVKTGIADSASPRRSGRRTGTSNGAITPGPSACGASLRWLRSFEGAPQPIRLSRIGTGVFWPHIFHFILDVASDGTEAHTFVYTPLYSHNPMTVGGVSSRGASAKVHKVSKPHAQRRSKRKRTTAADPKKNLTGDVNRLTPPSVPSALWTQMSSSVLEMELAEVLTNAEDTVLEVLCKDLVDPLCALAPMSDKSPGFSANCDSILV